MPAAPTPLSTKPCQHCRGSMALVRHIDLTGIPEIFVFYCSRCQHAAWAGASEQTIDACARATLIGRFVRPEEVAHAAVFVAENDALVGQVLTVDGGTSLKGVP